RVDRLFFFSSRRRHTRFSRDWSSDVCSSDLLPDSLGGRVWDRRYFDAGSGFRNLPLGQKQTISNAAERGPTEAKKKTLSHRAGKEAPQFALWLGPALCRCFAPVRVSRPLLRRRSENPDCHKNVTLIAVNADKL